MLNGRAPPNSEHSSERSETFPGGYVEGDLLVTGLSELLIDYVLPKISPVASEVAVLSALSVCAGLRTWMTA